MEIEALIEGSALSRLGTMPPPASQSPAMHSASSNPQSASNPDSTNQTPNSGSQTPTDTLIPGHADPKWSDAVVAYSTREGRKMRYAGKRVGGTVVVHYIKRNEWFLEAALALLGGEDELTPESGK